MKMKINLLLTKGKANLLGALVCLLSFFSSPEAKAQNGLNFNGSSGFNDDHIAVPHNSSLDFTELTFETWVYWTGSGLSNLFMKTGNNGIGDYGYGLAITGNGYLKWWQVYDGSQGPFSSGTAITANTWTHVAVTIKDGGTLSFYINGVLVGTNMAGFSSAKVMNGTKELIIGKQGPHDNYFRGTMDEVRIWNTVRTESEISSNMNTELVGNESGLVLYYKFNQGVASGDNKTLLKVCDNSGYGNHGILKGFEGLSGGSTANWVAGKTLTTMSTKSPEINVKGNGIDILNNDSIPSLADSTSLGSMNANVQRRYTIENTGDAPLTISKIEFVGTNASDFSILNAPTKINAGSSATFTVLFTHTSAGVKTAMVNIYNNDCDEGIYNFRMSRMVMGETLHFVGGNGQNSSFDYVRIPDNGTLDLANTYTIESWVYLDDSSNNTIIDKGDYRFLFQTHPAPGKGLGLYNQNNTGNWILSNGQVPIKEWCHVAVTFDAISGNVVFYLNGDVLSSHTGAVNGGQDDGDVNIGRQQPSGSYNFGPCQCNMFNGKMDELRVWNYALDSCEIRNRMWGEIPATASGLLANFHFNQGEANGSNSDKTLTDASGNNNHGTLQNFSLTSKTSNWVDSGAVATGVSFVYSEIAVKGNSSVIANLDATPSLVDSTDFGSVVAGTIRTFTLENTGTDTMLLYALNVVGTHASDFTILNAPNKVLPLDSVNIAVKFSPSATGLRNAQVLVNNSDCNEGDFRFAIAATGDFSSVNKLNTSTSLVVFPNPATGMITLSNMAMHVQNEVVLFNASGMRVLEFTTSKGAAQVDITQFPAGVYSVMVRSVLGSETQLLIIE